MGGINSLQKGRGDMRHAGKRIKKSNWREEELSLPETSDRALGGGSQSKGESSIDRAPASPKDMGQGRGGLSAVSVLDGGWESKRSGGAGQHTL